MPDLEERFWRRYRDQGLVVVALDPFDKLEQIEQVQEYVGNIGGITYDVGIGGGETYRAMAENISGPNPFPLDILVGKDGKIAYIAREYDADAMAATIERLLGK